MPANHQTVPRAQREAALLDAAHAEMAAAGFDDATVAAIARRAGMTSANVHYYFPTKELLAAAVVERVYDQLFAELAALDDPVERLHRYVRFHLANHALRGQLQAVATRSPEVAAVLRRREEWVREQAHGLARDALDADALTATVTGLIEVSKPHPKPRAVLDRCVDRILTVHFHD